MFNPKPRRDSSCTSRAMVTISLSSPSSSASSISWRSLVARMCVPRNVIFMSGASLATDSPPPSIAASDANRTNSGPVRPRASAKASMRSHSPSRNRIECVPPSRLLGRPVLIVGSVPVHLNSPVSGAL